MPATILELATNETMPIGALTMFIVHRIDKLMPRLRSFGVRVAETDSHTPPGRIV